MLQHLQLKPGTFNIKPGGKVSLNRLGDAPNVSLKILVTDVKSVILEKLPEGFQRAEYLLDHGMVDMVVHRHDLRPTLARLCRLLTKSPAVEHPKPAPQLPPPAKTVEAADAPAVAPTA